MEASDLKRMKELDAENNKLKRMYADMALCFGAFNYSLKDFVVV